MLTLIVGLAIIYFAILILVAIKYKKIASKSVYDLFLAGKRLPFWVIGLAFAATLLGPGDVIGHVGFSWEVGIVAINFVFAGAVGIALTGIILGPIWSRSKELTLPAWLHTLLPSKVLRALVSANLALLGLIGVGLITLGFATILEYIVGIPVFIIVILTVLVMIIYCSIGGQLAISYNDVIMMISIWILLIPLVYFSLTIHGGISGLVNAIHSVDPVYTNFWEGLSPLTLVNLWIAGLFVHFGLQVSYQKIASAKSKKAAVYGPVFSGVQVLIFTLLITLVGLAAIPLVRELSTPDFVIMWFGEYVGGELLLAALFIFILATVMSTGASFLFGAANNILNDWISMFKPGLSEVHLIRLSRVLLIICGIFGVFLALHLTSVFFGLMWCFAVGASIAPVILASAWWKEGGKLGHISSTGKPYITKNAAIASVATGMGTAILSGYIPSIGPIFGGGAIFSFGFALLVLLVGTAIERGIKRIKG